MGKINIKPEIKTVKLKGGNVEVELYTRGKLNKFNPKVLGIGNVSAPSAQVQAIAAVFDLSGFTNFCRQVDPHLSVPKYLSRFLGWLFDGIKDGQVDRIYRKGKSLFADLPFFAKFLGDGVLFLWETENMSTKKMCNVLVLLSNICRAYSRELVPEMKKELSDVPPVLRCGVARGTVCSVGNGEDYVGPCINIASRLQKLSRLTFCFARRGFDYEEGMKPEAAQRHMVKSVAVRDIGDKELVCVRKAEFDRLPKREKAYFKDV